MMGIMIFYSSFILVHYCQ